FCGPPPGISPAETSDPTPTATAAASTATIPHRCMNRVFEVCIGFLRGDRPLPGKEVKSGICERCGRACLARSPYGVECRTQTSSYAADSSSPWTTAHCPYRRRDRRASSGRSRARSDRCVRTSADERAGRAARARRQLELGILDCHGEGAVALPEGWWAAADQLESDRVPGRERVRIA